jgi:hypothetical protein
MLTTYSSAAAWQAAVNSGSIVNDAFEAASSGFIVRIDTSSAVAVTWPGQL